MNSLHKGIMTSSVRKHVCVTPAVMTHSGRQLFNDVNKDTVHKTVTRGFKAAVIQSALPYKNRLAELQNIDFINIT